MKQDGAARAVLMTGARRIVIKIGSSMLTGDDPQVLEHRFRGWVAGMAHLRQQGREVIVVSSGAVAEGRKQMARRLSGVDVSRIRMKQALAAIGQPGVIRRFTEAFAPEGILPAQVLLTHDDLKNRRRYLNARNTIDTLLDWGCIPIVNENDTVQTEELRKVGDNDTLASLVAVMMGADLLILLSDVDGLYSADPRKDSNAAPIGSIDALDPLLAKFDGGPGSSSGTGGIVTKIAAARRCTRAGAATILVDARHEKLFERIVAGEALGTLFRTQRDPVSARKAWIAELPEGGRLTVDEGAAAALGKGKSLLPVGVKAVEGEFERGEAVAIVTGDGAVLARGLAAYSAEHLRVIAGRSTGKIQELLGFYDGDEVVHRDDMILLEVS